MGASLQGCILAAGAAAGAAGGYEAKKHGYEVQSPVEQDSAGGYKGQAPVVKHPDDSNAAQSGNGDSTGNNDSDRSYNDASGGADNTSDYGNGTTSTTTTDGN